MSYPPTLVANAVMHYAGQRGEKLDHMKLQKLIFFLHAWSLALYGRSPVAEKPEAWPYGPVFSSLYHRLKGFGARPVDQYVSDLNPQTGELMPMIPNPQDRDFWSLLDRVWERYGHFDALQLSAITHEADSPWAKTRAARAAQISDELIQNFYRPQLHGYAAPRGNNSSTGTANQA